MRNVSNKSCRENQNPHFVSNNFFFSENRAVNGIMWKNIVERIRPQMKIRGMRIACWILKATNTSLEYVILFFHCNNGRTKAPHCYVIRTVPVLFNLCTISGLTHYSDQTMGWTTRLPELGS